MDPQQALAIAQKIKEETSTQEEELALLEFLNQGVDEMREFIKQYAQSK